MDYENWNQQQQKIESCLYLSFISLLVVYGEFSTSYIQYLKNNTKMYTHSTRLAWRYPDIATIEIVWIDNPTHSLHKKYWMYVHWNVSILHFNFRAMGIENSTTPLLILFFSYFSSPSLSLHSLLTFHCWSFQINRMYIVTRLLVHVVVVGKLYTFFGKFEFKHIKFSL